MANYNDIGAKFGIVYTCNCGWLDRAHSHPWSNRPGMGAAAFWQTIVDEKGEDAVIEGHPGFAVEYKQDAARKVMGIKINPSVGRKYIVRRNLSNMQKKQVALAIFIEVSLAFEERQASFVARKFSDSGFSEEDLVSNLIGFYRAMYPMIEVDQLCKPVSVEASRAVWKNDGAVGINKNRSFTPRFHACTECKETPVFPKQFQLIAPAPKGVLFTDYRPGTKADGGRGR